MAIVPGTRVGLYEVTGSLGEGGMGLVVRARDTKLHRDVALKLLPDHLAGDPERAVRLEREAQLLASLNHPNIAQVYGLEQSDGVSCIVMELVEGPTLADRVAAASGALPFDETIQIALQIVSALEAAHSRGIVHRDLKPANIKISADGQAKVLDFGLATSDASAAFGASGSDGINVTNSPTVMATSMPGVIMGTLAYMSPEQARGTMVDSRTDIWSFGCVLYEMLTGRQPFAAETPTDVVAKIVTTSPDWGRLPTLTPSAIRLLLRASLDKDPKKRLQHIGDARLFLERDALADAVHGGTPAGRSRRFVWPGLVAVFALAAAFAGWCAFTPASVEPSPVLNLAAALPEDVTTIGPWLTVSHDGTRVVFEANDKVYLLSLTDTNPEAKPIRGLDLRTFSRWAAFSPNDDELAYIDANDRLKTISLSSGAAVTLLEGVNGGTLSWSDDGSILFTTGGAILRIPADGGAKPETLATTDAAKGEPAYVSAELLPGGRYILASTVSDGRLFTPGMRSGLDVVAVDVKTGRRTVLLRNVGTPWFAQSGRRQGIGHVIYENDSGVMAAGFNANTLELRPPALVFEESRFRVDGRFAVSRTGALIYRAIPVEVGSSAVVWVDRVGNEQPLPAIPVGGYASPRLSPDGRRVALAVRESRGTYGDLSVFEFEPFRRIQVTFGGENVGPVWPVDGSRLFYSHRESQSNEQAAYSVTADGNSRPVSLWDGQYRPSSISRDWILIGQSPIDSGRGSVRGRAPGQDRSAGIRGGRGGRGSQLWTTEVGRDGKRVGERRPFLDDRFSRGEAEFSPDGKWVAFRSNQNGVNDVFVTSFPAGEVQPVSTGGGEQPRWNSNGRELFYRNGNKMMAVAMTPRAGSIEVGSAQVMFEKAAVGYDVAPNGTRFLMLRPVVSRAPQRLDLHVTLNWFDELRRRAPLPE